LKISRRWFLTLLLLSACTAKSTSQRNGLVFIGSVNYDQSSKTLDQYDRFKRYLQDKTQSLVELEPVLNEDRALERIQSQAWSLVFAPPGLSAIAIAQHQYVPLFPLTGVQSRRSVLVVREDSPIQDIQSLSGKTLALGQPGSATGYYFPLFNLYGLTLAEIFFASTPKAILEAVAEGKATAGALSVAELDAYSSEVNQAKFRILFADSHPVPAGAILVSPTVDRTQQESFRQILQETSSVVAEEAGFVTNAPVPDYSYMISVVKRVRSLFSGNAKETEALLQQKPVHLFKGTTEPSHKPHSTLSKLSG
jgi:phosphonate transport system substrate-binding protein